MLTSSGLEARPGQNFDIKAKAEVEGVTIRRGQKVKANVYAESNFTRTLKQTDPTNPTALIYLRT